MGYGYDALSLIMWNCASVVFSIFGGYNLAGHGYKILALHKFDTFGWLQLLNP